MPATPTEVTRTDDVTGDTFAVFENDASRLVQAVAFDPEVQGELLTHFATAGAAENTFVVKATPGRLFRIEVSLDPTATVNRWWMLFDQTTAPTNGLVPVFRLLLPGGGVSGIDYGVFGREFSNGIAAAVSTTIATLTLPGVAEAYFQGAFV